MHFNGLFIFNRKLTAFFYKKRIKLCSDISVEDYLRSECKDDSVKLKPPPLTDEILLRIQNVLKANRVIYKKVAKLFFEHKISFVPPRAPPPLLPPLTENQLDQMREKIDRDMSSDESEMGDGDAIDDKQKSKKIKIRKLGVRKSNIRKRKLSELVENFDYISEKEIWEDKKLYKIFLKQKDYGIEDELSLATKTLYVSNVSETTTEKHLQKIIEKLFSKKALVKIDIFKEGFLKGVAFIAFAEKHFAMLARRFLNRMVLNGQAIFVDFKKAEQLQALK
ncbi:small nuclear ribonucleoprotein 35kDa (U11 U12), variant 2 [Bonamia ostreae]|uniref:Small nuclear ribonucleoprotein 35kDa (U11 U12), variant 2 n=1 Tax=Bonamia ostreae TaxID=126728 RepID=A0ABV2AIS5_9EUKA